MSGSIKNSGFTLIELLVVIAIIGTLASVVLASLNTAREKGRDANRVAQVREIQNALALHYSESGTYPVSGWICSYEAGWQTGALATGLDPYMPTMPLDPINDSGRSFTAGNNSYCYYAQSYGGSGKWYMLVFQLEGQDMDFEAQDGVTACNGQIFNYGGEDGYILTVGGDC